jgi:hypothetical protein
MSKTFKDAPDRKFNRREAIKTIHDFAEKNSATFSERTAAEINRAACSTVLGL